MAVVTVELHYVRMWYQTHKLYLRAMGEVEGNQTTMLQDLANMTGLTPSKVAEFIAGCEDRGATFDERLYAAHAGASARFHGGDVDDGYGRKVSR